MVCNVCLKEKKGCFIQQGEIICEDCFCNMVESEQATIALQKAQQGITTCGAPMPPTKPPRKSSLKLAVTVEDKLTPQLENLAESRKCGESFNNCINKMKDRDLF